MIERGRPWGKQVPAPPDLLEIDSDAELADALDRGASQPLLLCGGDLATGLGARTTVVDDASTPTVRELPIDALRVHLDDREVLAVAHVVARSRNWLRGPIVFVGNTGFVGRREVVRRGHPNDGRFEIVEIDAGMGTRERLMGLRRIGSGSHLAHPQVTSTQATSLSRYFERGLRVWVDGRPLGRVSELRVEIIADAGTIYR